MNADATSTVDLNGRYGLKPAHSEVVEACRLIKPGDALDMGCSSGRNALYLNQLGFDVTAIDANPDAIDMLQAIIERERLSGIQANVYDINQANLDASYDFIACTVTLMFLDPTRMEGILANIQDCTRAGGHNLIVCAMDTDDYPCPVNFPFTLGSSQLSTIYDGWELLKYNENLGTMHNGAQMQFATMLACKPG